MIYMHGNSGAVCIKTRSPPASLSIQRLCIQKCTLMRFKGKITEHTTIRFNLHFLHFEKISHKKNISSLFIFVLRIIDERFRSILKLASCAARWIPHLPGAEVNLSVRRYPYTHIFSSHVVILRMLNIPEIRIRCPYKVCWVKSHVEWSGRVMFHPGIFPPLSKEYIHAVFLKGN